MCTPVRILFAVNVVCCFQILVSSNKSFTVDYTNNCFLKDGEPFRFVSGSIHYFRVPWQFWSDRIYKMKMAGLNAIHTYVEWSQHEPEPGVYNFDGNYDLINFIQTARDFEMLVVLRIGPFIDGERDMGGLPYWLMRIDPDIKLRSYDKTFIKYVDKWCSVLLPLIRPHLYHNGGPIISLQVENEFGGYGTCDPKYTLHLRDLFRRYLENEVILFANEGFWLHVVTCGRIDGVLTTVDFGIGSDAKSVFRTVRSEQSGPLVNSEFYSGWMDHWGQPHAHVDSEAFAKSLSEMLSLNASVNIYMFHGGTSFGFTAGSNLGGTFQVLPTSYDYDAPLSEAGDPTDKYYSIRSTIGKFMPLPPGKVPEPSPKMKLGPIPMKKVCDIWDFIQLTSESILSPIPLPFEDLKQPFGFVIYQTTVPFTTVDPVLLSIPGLRDRGHVFVEQVLHGVLSRELKIFSIPLNIMKNQVLSILVENQGRICYGPETRDRKGIIESVTLGTETLYNWTMIPVDISSENSLKLLHELAVDNGKPISIKGKVSTPAFYSGTFTLSESEPLGTFLRVDGWHKGVALLNGFNLGRYWPILGPQVTLYVPSVLFRRSPGINVLTLLELDHAPCEDEQSCSVSFVQEHEIDGTTPASKH